MISQRLQPLVRQMIVALVALVVCAGAMTFLPTLLPAAEAPKLEPLSITTDRGTTKFEVEVAATDEARETGLMYRSSLAPDRGMLFDFKETQPVYFWMKNTYVPLDMIFIRADGTVASVAENTVPLSEAVVPSKVPVRFVLEVVAGTASRIGLKAGDRVSNALMKAGG